MNILCATDLLPKSEPAVERAGKLADALSAELTLLHVVAPDDVDGQALEQRLQHARRRLASHVRPLRWPWRRSPKTQVRCGSPANVLVDTLAKQRAALVVLGPGTLLTRKRPTLKRQATAQARPTRRPRGRRGGGGSARRAPRDRTA